MDLQEEDEVVPVCP